MNKLKYKTNNLLNNVIKRFPNEFRKIENKLFCSLCEKFVTFDSKHGSTYVSKHINTSLHKDNKRIKEIHDKTKQQSITEGLHNMGEKINN